MNRTSPAVTVAGKTVSTFDAIVRGSECLPGPGQYDVQAAAQKTQMSRGVHAVFGAPRYMAPAHAPPVALLNPGPAAYTPTTSRDGFPVALGGPDSFHATFASGRSNPKVFVSKQHAKAMLGLESPGPAKYWPVSEEGEKRNDSAVPAPASPRCVVNPEHKPPLHARPPASSPGPGAHLSGQENSKRTIAWSFGKALLQPAHTRPDPLDNPRQLAHPTVTSGRHLERTLGVGRESPGPAQYDIKRQVSTAGVSFSRHPRPPRLVRK
jgi:hypothetical protein